MSAAAPWSVKAVDPKAREIAKDLARRSGMTLGEWLNSMILESDGDPPTAPSPSDLTRLNAAIDAVGARLEAVEQRTGMAIQSIDAAVSGLVQQIEQMESRVDSKANGEEGFSMTGPSREEIDARFREMEARAESREVALNAKLDRISDKIGQLSDHVIGARQAAEDATKATIVTRWNLIAIAISAVVGIVAIVLATNALMVSTAQLAAGSSQADRPTASREARPPSVG